MDLMSWSDDMRCLHCDGKLPLYRKITHGQFCSTNHRKAYWQEQERLAVERLLQTHSSLKAMRPPVPAESILGPAVHVDTGLRGFVAPAKVYPQAQGAPWMLAADPLIYEMERGPGKPVWSALEPPVRSLPGAGLMRLLQVWFGPAAFTRMAGRAAAWLPRGGDFAPRPASVAPVDSLALLAVELPVHLSLGPLERIEVGPWPAAPVAAPSPRNPLRSRMPRPQVRFKLSILPVTPEMELKPESDPPAADHLLRLAKFGAREFTLNRFSPQVSSGIEALALLLPPAVYPQRSLLKTTRMTGLAGSTRLPFAPAAVAAAGKLKTGIEALAALLPSAAYPQRSLGKTTRMAGLAGPARLNAVRAAAPASVVGAPRAAAFLKPTPAQAALVLPLRQLSLAMGRGSRYPVQFRHVSTPGQLGGPVDFPVLAADVVLPAPPATATVAPGALLDAIVPEPTRMVPLKVRFGPPVSKPIQPLLLDIATLPQPLRTEHIIRSSGLEPLDEKPVSDHFQADDPASASTFVSSAKAHLWTHAAHFWKLAPRDLKLLAFAIPALLALAFHRELPKVHVAAPAVSTAQLRSSIHNAVNTQLTSVRQAVMERAGVALDDDFRSGLDDWASSGDATAEWSFDANGFVRPGPLALYRPSMNLSDYQLQFLGMIDKQALSWVVRATDFENYYVVKLRVLKPGPRTTLGLTRYAVIHGKAQDRVETPVPLEAQPDTLYRVGLDLDGENFSLVIQGLMIDSWSEPRLKHGGVGFFTSPGEDSRLRWVAVRHQYDMLGRLCAYLAPYETPTTNGSW
jgi:hypothetical protein